MNTNVKKCLFGGALLGAGLCSSATAGDVYWDYSYNFAFVHSHLSYDSDDRVDVPSYAGEDWNLIAATPSGSYARTTGDSFGLDMAAYSADALISDYHAYSYSYSYGSFSVTTDTTMLLSWISDQTRLYLYESGNIMLNINDFGVGDSFEYTFLASEYYFLQVKIVSNGYGNLSTFNMGGNTVNVVPLPPAAFAGLGMLAGLGAYRRIRK